MTPGYDRPLYILAFDHRTSFQTKLFGIAGEPTAADRERMAEAKLIILDGLLAVAEDMPDDVLGALTDEERGADAARAAKARGLTLALAAEKSSQPEFEFEYGEDFGAHIEAFGPDFVKVLVRYDPDGDNAAQAARLARLSRWLAPREPKLLFELLVPGRTAERVATAIAELQAAGVEPDVWKVEGMEAAADYRVVAEAARAGGRDQVGLVVLGAGADEETVAHWLREAAGVEGFIGFAIGRTIFWDALTGWLRGAIDRDEAVATIAGNYRRTIELYAAAAQPAA
jgi:myo-inositol catabolism protein IolC